MNFVLLLAMLLADYAVDFCAVGTRRLNTCEVLTYVLINLIYDFVSKPLTTEFTRVK